MDIPTDLVTNWKREGYTHLHLGGVRLILTLHGRKGLPVTARIALLDTRFKQYQHAVTGTIFNHSPCWKYTYTIPTIIQIPKQIQKQELLQLMPLEWLTNYEQFHQNSEPVQTSQAVFERRPDGQVKLSFQTPAKPNPESPRLFYTAMITVVSTEQESNLPIYGFSSEGYPVYPDKVNGHFLWDVPEPHMCNPDCPCLDNTDDDEDFEIMRQRRRRKKKPSTPTTSCRPYSSGPPDDPESDQSLPIYKKALRQLQRESSFKPVPAQPKIKSCLMFSSSSQSYQESFPPLERNTDPQTKVVSQPYVQSPITTSGVPEAPKQYEAVLN
ncbi:hypothetical protein KPL71_026385 [Citrus sinensis]|uniref:Uncharacterized protein n=1 Tax=Citrus sinensis TaxID=2711 RepID=A0ACB8I0P2_CITSI|nr:hypothetical protein KPL71_026385 [Citrus sinensis]